jgi:hypothetical protein
MFYGAEIFLAPVHQRRRGENRVRDNRGIVKKLRSIQRRVAIMIVGGMTSSPGDILDVHADLPPIHLAIDRHLHKAALRYASLPNTHPLHKAVANASKRHVKKHPSPLHFLMNAYPNVRQGHVEMVVAVRKTAAWKPRVDVRVASSKEEG